MPETINGTGLPLGASDLAGRLQSVLEATIELQAADSGTVQLYDPQAHVLRVVAQHGLSKTALAHFTGMGKQAHSIFAVALRRRNRVNVEDIVADPEYQYLRSTLDLEGIRGLQATALLDRHGQPLGVLSTQFRKPRRLSERELRLTDLFARQASDLIGAQLAEDARRSSEERLRLALTVARMGTWSWDPKLDLALYDERSLELFGAPAGSSFSVMGNPQLPMHSDDAEDYRRAMTAALDPEGSGHLEVEFRCIHRSGSQVWLQQSGQTYFESRAAQRRAVRVAGTIRNISRLKSTEERRLLLAREIDHRAKNLLATIQAMVSLSARSHTDLREFVTAIQERIVALARAHDLMAVTQWQGVGLRQLINQELLPYAAEQSQVATLEGPDVILRPAATTALSMVLHELATNAAKYGALCAPGGHVRVRWQYDTTGALRMEWSESGGPRVTPPRHRGFGSILILRSMELELGGGTETYFEPDGVRCSITLPASQLFTS